MNELFYQILYYGYIVLNLYYYLIIITVLLSWTPLVKTKFYGILQAITAPYMNIFRGLIVISNIDLTPLLGFILYQVLLSWIGSLL